MSMNNNLQAQQSFLEDPQELAKESRQALFRTVVVNGLILAGALAVNQLAATAFDRLAHEQFGGAGNVLMYKGLYVVFLMIVLYLYLDQVKVGRF